MVAGPKRRWAGFDTVETEMHPMMGEWLYIANPR
jgi:hypothetical protein